MKKVMLLLAAPYLLAAIKKRSAKGDAGSIFGCKFLYMDEKYMMYKAEEENQVLPSPPTLVHVEPAGPQRTIKCFLLHVCIHNMFHNLKLCIYILSISIVAGFIN